MEILALNSGNLGRPADVAGISFQQALDIKPMKNKSHLVLGFPEGQLRDVFIESRRKLILFVIQLKIVDFQDIRPAKPLTPISERMCTVPRIA